MEAGVPHEHQPSTRHEGTDTVRPGAWQEPRGSDLERTPGRDHGGDRKRERLEQIGIGPGQEDRDHAGTDVETDSPGQVASLLGAPVRSDDRSEERIAEPDRALEREAKVPRADEGTVREPHAPAQAE
jgi:hypothetical protein